MTAPWPTPPKATWWTALWQRFWALPLLVAVASLGLGLLLPVVDATAEETPGWVFQGGVDGARSVLGTIAGAMISVTGLVFSITMVVLQLASSQFSPRILRSFLESRVVQLTLGVFTGSFLYALTVLRAVRGGDDGRVPQLAVTASYVYVVVAVAMFLAFIHHITTSVQVTQVMADVRRRTVRATRRLAAPDPPRERWEPAADADSVPLVNTERCGYVTSLDRTQLARVAQEHDVVVELDVTPGQHVAAGQPLGRLWYRDEPPDDACDAAVAAVHVEAERDVSADAGFGVRQLLDVAERALSPGVNDPTTAVQAVNELRVVLRVMVQLNDPVPDLVEDDRVLAVYRSQRFAGILGGVVAELTHHGGGSLRVVPQLRSLLEDLRTVARPQHLPVVESALRGLRP